MAKRPGIDFSKIDQKAVSILCRDAKNVEAIVAKLTERGLKVQVETQTHEFFKHLDEGVPGHVLISRTFKTAVGLQLPGFLQRKFGIPVATFVEEPSHEKSELAQHSKEPDETKIHLQPEILHIRSTASEDEVTEHIANFQKDYHQRLEDVEAWKAKLAETQAQADLAKAPEKLWQSFQDQVEEKILEWDLSTKLKVDAMQVRTEYSNSLLVWSVPESFTDEQSAAVQKGILEMIEKSLPGVQSKAVRLSASSSWEHYAHLIAKAEHQISGVFFDVEVMVSVFPDAPQVQAEIKPEGEGYSIPLENWFVNESVSFRLYLWMEQNQKKLLYVRPGLSLLEKSFRRFQNRGLKALHIDREDRERYEIIRSLIAS